MIIRTGIIFLVLVRQRLQLGLMEQDIVNRFGLPFMFNSFQNFYDMDKFSILNFNDKRDFTLATT